MRGSRFFFWIVGMGELHDSVNHELVIMDGCEWIGKYGVKAIEMRGIEAKCSRVVHTPFLKYIFKINAYSPDFI